jgi:hypothetical protein
MLFEELAAAIIGISMLLSIGLFSIEVFVKRRWRSSQKRRGMSGQAIGLVFSLIAAPLFFIAFCDKLPGHPIGLRDALLALPSITKANAAFGSSVIILVVLVLTYVLRFVIYSRLFVIPALTMTEAEFNKRDNVEERANDLSAPGLAYLTFALTLTAVIAGAYALPVAVGIVMCLGLVAIYYLSSYLYNLEKSLIWLTVQVRILARRLWLIASRLVVLAILVIGRMEAWRRRQVPGDQLFFEKLENSLRQSQLKAAAGIARDQEILRDLTARDEQDERFNHA